MHFYKKNFIFLVFLSIKLMYGSEQLSFPRFNDLKTRINKDLIKKITNQTVKIENKTYNNLFNAGMKDITLYRAWQNESTDQSIKRTIQFYFFNKIIWFADNLINMANDNSDNLDEEICINEYKTCLPINPPVTIVLKKFLPEQITIVYKELLYLKENIHALSPTLIEFFGKKISFLMDLTEKKYESYRLEEINQLYDKFNWAHDLMYKMDLWKSKINAFLDHKHLKEFAVHCTDFRPEKYTLKQRYTILNDTGLIGIFTYIECILDREYPIALGVYPFDVHDRIFDNRMAIASHEIQHTCDITKVINDIYPSMKEKSNATMSYQHIRAITDIIVNKYNQPLCPLPTKKLLAEELIIIFYLLHENPIKNINNLMTFNDDLKRILNNSLKFQEENLEFFPENIKPFFFESVGLISLLQPFDPIFKQNINKLVIVDNGIVTLIKNKKGLEILPIVQAVRGLILDKMNLIWQRMCANKEYSYPLAQVKKLGFLYSDAPDEDIEPLDFKLPPFPYHNIYITGSAIETPLKNTDAIIIAQQSEGNDIIKKILSVNNFPKKKPPKSDSNQPIIEQYKNDLTIKKIAPNINVDKPMLPQKKENSTIIQQSEDDSETKKILPEVLSTSQSFLRTCYKSINDLFIYITRTCGNASRYLFLKILSFRSYKIHKNDTKKEPDTLIN